MYNEVIESKKLPEVPLEDFVTFGHSMAVEFQLDHDMPRPIPGPVAVRESRVVLAVVAANPLIGQVNHLADDKPVNNYSLQPCYKGSRFVAMVRKPDPLSSQPGCVKVVTKFGANTGFTHSFCRVVLPPESFDNLLYHNYFQLTHHISEF